jgi:hypothetical protein
VLPHVSAMMSDSMEDVIKESDIIVVSHDLKDGGEQLIGSLRPNQLVIDLVKIVARQSQTAAYEYEGICW